MDYAELIRVGTINLRNLNDYRMSPDAYWNFVALLNTNATPLVKDSEGRTV